MKKYRKSRRAAAQAADGQAEDSDDISNKDLNPLLLPSTNSLQRVQTTSPLNAPANAMTSGAAPTATTHLSSSLKASKKTTTTTIVETTSVADHHSHVPSFNKAIIPPSPLAINRATFCSKRLRLPAIVAVLSLFLLFLLGLFSPYTTVASVTVSTGSGGSSSSKVDYSKERGREHQQGYEGEKDQEKKNTAQEDIRSSDKSTSTATASSREALENWKPRRNRKAARVFDIYDYIDNGQMKMKTHEVEEEEKEVKKCDLTNINDLYRKRIARSLSLSGVDEASESNLKREDEEEKEKESERESERETKQSRGSSLYNEASNIFYPYDLHHKTHWKLRDDFNAEEFCAQFPADGAARVYRGVRNAKGEVTRPTMAKLFHPPDWNSDVFEEETARFLTSASRQGNKEGKVKGDDDEQHHVAFRPLKARKTPARLFYGFMFGVEFDMLDLVLHEIYPIVDKIAIIESDISHSLKRKEAVLWKATGQRTHGANTGGKSGSGGDIDGKGAAAPFEERFSRYFKPSSSSSSDGAKRERGGGDDHAPEVTIHPNRIGDKIHVFIFSPRKGKVYKSGWDVEMRQRNMFHHLLPSLGVRDGDIVIGNMDMDELLTAATLLKLKYCELDAANNEDERRVFRSMRGRSSGSGGNAEDKASANTGLSSAGASSSSNNNSPTFSIVHFRYHFGCLQEIRTAVMTDTIYVWDEEKVRKTKNLYQARKGMVNFILPALNSALNRKGWAGNPSIVAGQLTTKGTGGGGGGEDVASAAPTLSSSTALTLQADPTLLFDIFNNNTSNMAMEQQQQPKKASHSAVWDPSLGAKREVYFATKREKELLSEKRRGPLAQTDEKQQKSKSASSSLSEKEEENTESSIHHGFSSDSSIIDINEAFNRDLNALQGSMAWHMSTFGGVELLRFKRANSPHRFVEDGKGSDQALVETIDACFFNDVYRARVSLWEQNAPLLLRSIDSPCRWGRPKNGA